MKFGEIDNIIFIGGSEILPDLCKFARDCGFGVKVVSGERLMTELVDGITLREKLNLDDISCYEIADINIWDGLDGVVTKGTFGISIGSPWIFAKSVIELFAGKMANIQPVGIPLFDGGAHFSWQILMGSKEGTTLVQMINEKLNAGEVVLSDVYVFPSTARIPQDYFEASRESRLQSGRKFLNMLLDKSDFQPYSNEPRFRTFYPRLYTMEHGYINWHWSGEEIEQFICAFDEPYAGASTFIGDERIWLKDVTFDRGSSSFHPYMSGIIYKKTDESIIVAVNGGSLIVRKALDENGASCLHRIKIGKRLFTPNDILDKSLIYNAVYTADGIEED